MIWLIKVTTLGGWSLVVEITAPTSSDALMLAERTYAAAVVL